jgi:hypothetical protein
MFLAIFGIIVIALISAIFVAGFTNGARTFRKIKGSSRRARAEIYEKMVSIDAIIRINGFIERLNKGLPKLHIREIHKIELESLIIEMKELQEKNIHERRELLFDQILNAKENKINLKEIKKLIEDKFDNQKDKNKKM